MRKFYFLIIIVVNALSANAQYKVRFILKEKSAIKHDSIYITGTFNNWDSSANKNYLLHPLSADEKFIVLNLPGENIRYKFHRGSWFTVEKKYYGNEVPDHPFFLRKDTTLKDTVESWRDQIISDKQYALTGKKAILIF